MCLTVKSSLKKAKKDFYTLKIAESVTLQNCISYYKCVMQKYKVLYTADMLINVEIGESVEIGLHSYFDVNKLSRFNVPGYSSFDDCRGVILCRIPKGSNYYLGDGGDIVSNQLELLEPIVIWNNDLEQHVEVRTMKDALIHALMVCESYDLNMQPS